MSSDQNFERPEEPPPTLANPQVCPTCGSGCLPPPSASKNISHLALVQLVLERDLTSYQTLQECIQSLPDQTEKQDAFTLGQILVARRHLSSPQLLYLLEELRVESRKSQEEPRYRLDGILGLGGMGIVWKAYDQQLKRTVALKQLRDSAYISEEQLHRFQKEARSVGRLSHPNIVSIFDVGFESGRHYFTCDYIRGDSLAQHTQTPWDPRKAAQLLLPIARAVNYAHEQGIIHRDIKPSNILIDQNQSPRLADFGLAKEYHQDPKEGLTLTGQILGTPHYLSPEQARGDIRQIGPPCDQFSLGIVLYELLTATRPFQARDLNLLYEHILKDTPKSPSSVLDTIPVELDLICLKALEKNPSDRYPTVGKFADDLELFIQRKPISLRLPSKFRISPRIHDWTRQKQGPTILLLLMTLCLLGGWRWWDTQTTLRSLQTRHHLDQILLPLEQTLEQARSLLYVPDADLAPSLDHLENLIKKLEAAPNSNNSSRSATLLGRSWFLLGHQEKALSYLLRAKQIGSQDPLVAHILAQIYMRRSFLAALQHSEQRPQLDLEPFQQKKRRTQVAKYLKDPSSSRLPELEKTLNQAYRAQSEGDYDLVRTICQQAIERFNERPGTEFFWMLLARVSSSSTRQSRNKKLYYDRAIQRCPHQPWARFLRGNLLSIIAKRIADYDVALTVHRYLWYAYDNRAICRKKIGDLTGAKADYDEAIRLHPEDVIAQFNRSMLLWQQGDFQKAMDGLNITLNLQPEFSSAWVARGQCYEKLGDQDEAMKNYNRAIEISPNHEIALQYRGNLRTRRNDLVGALEDYSLALKTSPRNDEILWNRIQVLMKQKDHARAFEDLSRFLEIRPRNANAYYTRAIIRSMQNDAAGSARDYQQCISIAPSSWQAHLGLGISLRKIGKTKESIQSLRKAYELAPENERPRIAPLLQNR